MGELTKELMRRSQVAQAHSANYHPQTNGLDEKAESRVSIDADAILFPIHDRLGQISATSNGGLQVYNSTKILPQASVRT